MHPRTTSHDGLTANWWAGATAILALLLCIVVGNTAVLAGLRRTRRAPTHYPLASLAIADLCVGLLVVPVAALRELFVFELHWFFCTCWVTLDVFCSTSSILSLCTLGWERWSGITAPLARARRAKRAKLLAALVWPVSFAVAFPTAFVYTPKHHSGDLDKACPDNMNVTYVFVSSMLSFYVPGTVMVVLYGRILCALSVPLQIRSHRGGSPYKRTPIRQLEAAALSKCNTPLAVRSAEEEESQRSPMLLTPKGTKLNLPAGSKQVHCEVPAKMKAGAVKSSIGALIPRQRRATRTIVRLMVMFLLCWTPFFVILPVDSICDCVKDSIWQWFTWLGYMNSALNPLVYAAASPTVRQAMRASLSSSSRPTEIIMTPTRRV